MIQIPIIEPGKNGYWEVYDDGRKIWHGEKNLDKNLKFQDHKKSAQKHGLGSDWLELKEGDNKVRLLCEFEDYGAHFIKKENKTYVCLGKEECSFCQEDHKPGVKYIGYVIDRLDDISKPASMGHQIFKQIGELSKTDDFGFDEVIPPYDINIRRKGTGKPTEYTVFPTKNEDPLSDTEKHKADKAMKRSPQEIIDAMKEKRRKEISGE